MTTQSIELDSIRPGSKEPRLTMAGKKRIIRIIALIIMLIYSLVTLFPFYALFVRSFVSTKDSAELHLWIPEADPVNLDMQVGNLAVFYDLDLTEFKDVFDIPQSEFLMSRTTLRQVAAQYEIPESEIEGFFEGFYTFNGWMTLLGGSLYGTNFWQALGRTIGITVISLLLANILSIMTGYGLAGLKRRDQMVVYNIYLLQMVIPVFLILLPQFLLFRWFFSLFPQYSDPQADPTVRHILQLVAIILINIKGTALSTMIFTAAISAIPKELEDSAMIDGATRWQYMRYILLPLLKVPIISNTVILLPLFYNQFLEPYVYLDPANSTLLPFIQNAAGQFSTNFQLIYSAIFASVVPLVIVYILFRRYFVEGVLGGAIKG